MVRRGPLQQFLGRPGGVGGLPAPDDDSILHRAALLIADHEKVVVPGDREDAIVVRSGEATDPAGTPEELLERTAADPDHGRQGYTGDSPDA